MTKRKARVEQEIEEDLDDPDMWQAMPEMKSARAGSLGTQISLRLESADAGRLREIATARGVGHTSLLREWIRERLDAEENLLTTFTYETSGHAANANVQVSSGQLRIRRLAVA